jgi:hypothetical protein
MHGICPKWPLTISVVSCQHAVKKVYECLDGMFNSLMSNNWMAEAECRKGEEEEKRKQKRKKGRARRKPR